MPSTCDATVEAWEGMTTPLASIVYGTAAFFARVTSTGTEGRPRCSCFLEQPGATARSASAPRRSGREIENERMMERGLRTMFIDGLRWNPRAEREFRRAGRGRPRRAKAGR